MPKELKVRITNRTTQFVCPKEVLVEVNNYFRYKIPGAQFSEKYVLGIWDGYATLLHRGACPTGVFLEQKQKLKADGWKLLICDKRTYPAFKSLPFTPQIRPYQEQAVKAMIKNSNCGGIILNATGTGKTRIAGEYFRLLQSNACFVVDELTLLEQSREALSAVLGEKVGIIGNSKFLPERVTCATIQSLHKHRNKKNFCVWMEGLGALVIDELHTQLNRRNISVVSLARPSAVFGLTATLELSKEHVRLPATALTGPKIFDYPMSEGTGANYLARGVICLVKFPRVLFGTAPGYGDILSGSAQAEYRYQVARNGKRNACIAALARECYRRGRRIAILVEHISHVKNLSARLADTPHFVMSGAQSKDERRTAQKAMDAGKTRLLICTRVFGKGIDIVSLDTVIDATGLPGQNSAVQRYGRGKRKAEGKEGVLHFDISDTSGKAGSAARSRKSIYRTLGDPVIEVPWEENAPAVVDAALRRLRSAG